MDNLLCFNDKKHKNINTRLGNMKIAIDVDDCISNTSEVDFAIQQAFVLK